MPESINLNQEVPVLYTDIQLAGLEISCVLVARKYDPAAIPAINTWFKKIRQQNKLANEKHNEKDNNTQTPAQ